MREGTTRKKIRCLFSLLFSFICAGLVMCSLSVNAAELEVKEKKGKVIINGGFSYEVIPLEDEQEIPAGWKEISLLLYDVEVTAYEPVRGGGDFYLLYCKTSEDVKGFYRYDTQEQTIQRYQERSGSAKTEDKSTDAEVYNDRIMLMAGITGAACSVAILALAGVIKLVLKVRKENDDFFY